MDDGGNLVCIVCVGTKQHAKLVTEEDAVPIVAATGWYHSKTVRKGRRGLQDPLSPALLRLVSMCRQAANHESDALEAACLEDAERECDVLFSSGFG